VTHANHLKLMVDYNLKDPRIIAELDKLGALDVKTTIDCGYRQNTGDDVLVNTGTVEHKRLLLTKDKESIDEEEYPPCTHGGIIIIKHRRPRPEEVVARVTAFIRSGKRALAKGHVTHLRADGATIYTHKDPVEVRF
jgi:hypothetical protein